MFLRQIFVILVAFGVAAPAGAASLSDIYSSFWVLGDSLNDNGSTGAGGTSTDGEVWNDGIIDEFEAAGKTAVNLAYGGATASGTNDDPAGIVDLNGQVADFAEASAGLLGENALVALWIGGNDLRAAAIDPANAETILGTAIFNINVAMNTFDALGVAEVLLFSAPDMALIPEADPFFGPGGPLEGTTRFVTDPTDPLANPLTLASLGFNAALQAISISGLDITYFDAFSLTREAYLDPSAVGAELLGPCIVGDVQVLDCATTAFWDGIHPTTLVHKFIEGEVRAALVPLPAPAVLLLAALGGLAALRRRH